MRSPLAAARGPLQPPSVSESFLQGRACVQVRRWPPQTTNDSPRRRARSDKFALTLHLTGPYCKKIRGKLYYFGADKQEFLRRYQEQATYLHTGTGGAPAQRDAGLSLRTLCNLYLDHQEARREVGEISPRHFYDQRNLLKGFARYVGANRAVPDITTLDLQGYKKKLIENGKSPNTINNHIAAVKAMFTASGKDRHHERFGAVARNDRSSEIRASERGARIPHKTREPMGRASR